VTPKPYRPVLRGVLLTGGSPRFLRRGAGAPSLAGEQAEWWPPHKIAARHLAPYLADRSPLMPAHH
jgi:sulfide:quinone oxidoreductase